MEIPLKVCLALLLACPAFALAGPAAPGMRFRCEAERTQQVYCQVDTQQGITLVKQLSKVPCMQGRNWDFDRHGVWVSHRCRAEFITGRSIPEEQREQGMSVRCESRANQLERCPAETSHGVRLTRVLSTSECVENRDWGYDESGIWTARGCRAEFKVGIVDAVGRATGPRIDPQQQKLVCESDANQRKRCEAAVDRGVDMLRQLSRTDCVKGENWDWDDAGIWVDKGCRAEFGVH
jgi:DUF3011 family protein